MKVTFKPTNYSFDFADNYFVQVQYAGAFAEGKHKFVACFPDISAATAYADAQVEKDHIEAAYVFSREAQIHSAYARD